MKLGRLLAHLGELETAYADALRAVAARRASEHDVHGQCLVFAEAAQARAEALREPQTRYAAAQDGWAIPSPDPGVELLDELRSIHAVAGQVAVTWTMALQAAKALHDAQLGDLAATCHADVGAEAAWFLTRIKTGAPQALVVE